MRSKRGVAGLPVYPLVFADALALASRLMAGFACAWTLPPSDKQCKYKTQVSVNGERYRQINHKVLLYVYYFGKGGVGESSARKTQRNSLQQCSAKRTLHFGAGRKDCFV